MILGTIEGNLLGEIVIPLSKFVDKAIYKVIFEIRNDDGSFYSINPSFPVIEHEDRVVFRNTEDFAELYMRVTVELVDVKPDYSHFRGEEAGCDECKTLNENWKK